MGVRGIQKDDDMMTGGGVLNGPKKDGVVNAQPLSSESFEWMICTIS